MSIKDVSTQALLKKISDLTGCTRVKSVTIHAEANELPVMIIEKQITDAEVDAIAPIAAQCSLKSGTVVHVDESTKVRFEV